MDALPRVVIVTARCSRKKLAMGIRFEEKSREEWVGDWAFALREETVRKEKYDVSTITGSFSFAPSFPGCPYCKASSFFQCSCGGRTCWDGESRRITCAWCGMPGEPTGAVQSIQAGYDR